jgi:hypothetical protein
VIDLNQNYDVNNIQYICLHYEDNYFAGRLSDCNIQLFLDSTLISEVGPTISKKTHEIAGPASTTLPSSMITNNTSEIASKLYRPSNSDDIDTSFSFSEMYDVQNPLVKAITDSKGGIVAPLNNFTDADAHYTGLTFDGSINYIDLTSNSINVDQEEPSYLLI